MNSLLRKILMCLMLTAALCASAQRTVTPTRPATPTRPVRNEVEKKTGPPPSVVHLHDDTGRTIMVDTITGKEWVDSTMLKVPKMQYPLLHAMSVSVDIWDPLMRIINQKFGLAGAGITFSLHNRYFPLFEFGLGMANDRPSEANFTFHSPLSPYFRIGADYNIFYNNTSDYQLLVGLRYGISPFRWGLRDVVADNSYWGDPVNFAMAERNCLAGWLEVCLGVKVRIAGPLSLGWTFKFHQMLHMTSTANGKPMIIPGFGKRTTPVTAAFNIYYTFTLNPRIEPDTETE